MYAHLAACASRDETSPGPAMDYGPCHSPAQIQLLAWHSRVSLTVVDVL